MDTFSATNGGHPTETSFRDTKEESTKKRKLKEEDGQKRDEKVELLPSKRTKGREGEEEAMHSIMPRNVQLTVRNGIRYLSPYWYPFTGYAKERWIGQKVCDVFTKEFVCYHPDYAKAAIRKGRIFINGKQMTNPDYVFRISDRFYHLNHRHETEIPALPIQFIDETDDYLVINKPPGLPVHPCGHYNFHCVMNLLKMEYGRTDSEKLRPLYRLDRNTTGVLIFAKNKKADVLFKKCLAERKLKKEYIVKVEGIFPEEEVVCREPIAILSPTIRIRCVRSDGQEALSRFRRISVDPVEGTSLVGCQIETGRTHQIRVHLQYLGFPIVDDYIYNSETWGPAKGKGGDYGGKTMEQLIQHVTNRHDKKQWLLSTDAGYAQRIREVAENEMYEHEEMDLRTLDYEKMPDYDPLCWSCAIIEKREMVQRDWQMALHCWRYSGDGWSFEAPLPGWATSPNSSTNEEGTAITTCFPELFQMSPKIVV